MLIATTPFIAGWRVVETKGQVFGLVVRSRGLGGNIMAGLRSLGGGEIKEYTSLLEDTRRQAIERRWSASPTARPLRRPNSQRFGLQPPMSGSTVIRLLMGVIGAALLLGGIGLAFAGGGLALIFPVFWMVASGVVLIVVALIEISRYRSEAAEEGHVQPGPGGGENVAPEPRFEPTDEVFVDPTTQRRMRVFADKRTGERRYVAEG
jgi:putative heavy-metal-binding protein